MSKSLTDPNTLEQSLDGLITIAGIAANAKAGAVALIDQDTPIYIQGQNDWPSEVLGKRVVVEGLLRRQQLYPQVADDGEDVSQGMSGEAWTIEMGSYYIDD